MKKFDELQLRFELDLDETELEASEELISYEEARQISEAARLAFDQVRETSREGEGRGWFDEYLKLIELGWPWRVACYIAWAASPRATRWPKTLKELASLVLGLRSSRQIHTWRTKYPTIDEMVAMMQAAPLFEHRRDVIEALVKMASEPDYKSFNDRKLFLELVGDYVPRSQLDLGKAAKGDVQEMTDEELRKWLGENPHPNMGEGDEEATDADEQHADD
ncbi:MAG TPA: hypothetical protein VI729_13740 [Anaerolineales bacterium]|nr:hypothetical protein [Anaerolineales bacterium]